MTNQNQTDTNEMATTEAKCQTDFYAAEKYQYLTKLNKTVLKMPVKYQENTKEFATEIPNTDLVLVFPWYRYQIFCYRLTSLNQMTLLICEART